MRYRELVAGIKNFEEVFWFGKYVHVRQIIKMFLI